MKKAISLFLVILISLGATPILANETETITLDGLIYTIENAEATVKADKENKASLPEKVVIPSEINGYTVKHIGYMAFKDCGNVKEFVLPETIERIGPHGFEDCDSITSITIPGSVKYIDGFAFFSCDSLQTVTLNEGVEYLTSSLGGCFTGCENLKEIKLPESLLCIGYGTFSYCKSLEEVRIPKNVYKIENAFEGCTNLKKVTIDYRNLHYIMDDSGIIYDTDKKNFMKGLPYLKGVVTIPATMTRIPQGALAGTGVEQVIIHENVTEIDGGAFAGCAELRRITIPDQVSGINESTFRGSKKLEEVVLGAGVTRLGHAAFGDCKIDNLVIKSSELLIYEHTVTPDTHKGTAYVWRASFDNTTIGTIYAPVGSNGEKYADEKGIAFKNIEDYEYTPKDTVANFITEETEDTVIIKGYKDPTTIEIHVPGEINGKKVVLGKGAFEWTIDPDNRSLEKVTIAEGITSIPEECFYFSSVKEVNLPESVTEIGARAFSNCKNLEGIDIKNVVTISEGAFSGNENLVTVTHSGKLESIGRDAFSSCFGLKNIDLSTVKKLGVRAFSKCGLKEVNLQSLETWEGIDDSQADENGKCHTKQMKHSHGGHSYYIGLNGHVYAPFFQCGSLTEVTVRYPHSETDENFPALFLNCHNINSFTIENYQDAISVWECAWLSFDNTAGDIYLNKPPYGMTVFCSDNAAEEYAKKNGWEFVLTEDKRVEVEPKIQGIHGGIIAREYLADRITKIAQSMGGKVIVSGDNIAVQKDGKSMAIADDTAYYMENGKMLTEDIYESTYYVKIPEKALESVLGEDSRKSEEYKEFFRTHNSERFGIEGTVETAYGTIAVVHTNGIMHGFTNSIHFIKWDGEDIRVSAKAPYKNPWSPARWEKMELSEDGKILTITYPENKRKIEFYYTYGSDKTVLWDEGKYVVTANLETGEVNCVIKK